MIIKKIALDAGHGLKTSGKQTPDGIKEWTLNDKVRDKVVELLKDYNVEFIFPDKNEGNIDESLTSRRTMYLNQKVDAAISIHHNAYTNTWNKATGVEIFTDKNPTVKDKALAKAIYKNLSIYTGLKGRGIKEENWAVINQNCTPAVLVEGGFMDSTIDYPIITSDKGQEGYAKAIAEGLIEFLSLERKQVGWKQINSKWYYFDENCNIVTGWHNLSWKNIKSWYYFDDNGIMVASKWIKSKNKDYYLTSSGSMATNSYIKSTSSSVYYWVGADGAWQPEWNTNTPDLKKYKVVK